MADPKKTADLVLGLSSEGAPEAEAASAPPMGPLDATEEAKSAAAGDAMAAFKSNDVEGLKAALSSFVSACTGGSAGEEA